MSAAAPRLRYLSAADVDALLPPLGRRLEIVRETFAALAAGAVSAPPATCLSPRPTGFADAMPAYSAQLDLSSVKWVAGDELNRSRGLPYISGLILLSEGASGLPVAIIEAGAITAARTAAVSAAAVDALAAPGWSRVALIGHGRQARAHVRVLRSLNPDAAFRVASRRPPGPEPGIEPAASPREAVAGAEVVITAIPLSARLRPPLSAAWLDPDALVLPLDDDACLGADVLATAAHFAVDDVDRYRRDRQRGLFAEWPEPDGTVGAALTAPPAAEGLRVCMNQGLGAMDAPLADAVWRAAEERGAGLVLER